MFDRMSEYALNKKDKEAIIYSDAFGNITRLTAEDFSSEKEFRKWKNWVDMKTPIRMKRRNTFTAITRFLLPSLRL